MMALVLLIITVASGVALAVFLYARVLLRIDTDFQIKEINFDTLSKRVKEITQAISDQLASTGVSRLGTYLMDLGNQGKAVKIVFASDDRLTSGILSFLKNKGVLHISCAFATTDGTVEYVTTNSALCPLYHHPLADVKILIGAKVGDLWRYHRLRTEQFRGLGILRTFDFSGVEILQRSYRKELKFLEEDRYQTDSTGQYLEPRMNQIIPLLIEKVLFTLTKDSLHKEKQFPYEKDEIFMMRSLD